MNPKPTTPGLSAAPRLLPDTNVVLDRLHFRDAAALPLWQALVTGRCRCLVDDYALAELDLILAYPEFGLDAGAQEKIRADYQRVVERVEPAGLQRRLPTRAGGWRLLLLPKRGVWIK
jgi:hypothetical protein